MTTETNPTAFVKDNEWVIKTFLMDYLPDMGIQVQIVEAIARELFGQQVVVNGFVPEGVATAPKELFGQAIQDVLDVGLFGGVGEFSLSTVVAGAPSLEFLVRWARKLDPKVLPPEAIPSDEVVGAALELFHESKKDPVITA
jgi:hypothetical protein